MSRGRFDTVVCLDDLLRDSFWPAKEFIYDLVRVPLFLASGVDLRKSPRNGQGSNLLNGFSTAEFLRLCGSNRQWQSGYHGVPAAAGTYLASYLPPSALVVSYEMPPWLRQILTESGHVWLDIRLSPLRFASDLYLALATNDPALYAAIHAHSLPSTEIAAEAALLSARLRYRLRYGCLDGTLNDACIYIGQTASDASLFKANGEFVRCTDHAATLRQLATSGSLFYKPHPLAGDFAVAERVAIESITGRPIAVCEADTYELLAREEKFLLVGLSSGVLQEAPWFGREAYALAKPICSPRFDAAHDSHGYQQVAAHQFMSQPLWSAILDTPGQQPALLLPPRPNHLRELHNTWWGYSTTILRHSEFHREAAHLAGRQSAQSMSHLGAELRRARTEIGELRDELAQIRKLVQAESQRNASAPAATHLPRRALPRAV